MKISIIGSDVKHAPESTFTGTYINDDLDAMKSKCEQIINGYIPREDECSYDPSIGQVDYWNDCYSYDIVCPEKELYHARRELSRLKMRPCLTLAFSYPRIAALNDLLEGENIRISHL